VHNQAFNVGRPGETTASKQVAEIVQAQVPGSKIEFSKDAGTRPALLPRELRQDRSPVPRLDMTWNVEQGVAELVAAYQQIGLTQADLEGGKYLRIKTISEHIRAGRLGEDLRWAVRP